MISISGPVGVAVGGDDALLDDPGGLDLDVFLDLEDGIDAGSLSIGEERFAGVEVAADTSKTTSLDLPPFFHITW